MSPVQILLIVVLAVLAAVVLYQLYAVLGRKAGRAPGTLKAPVNYRRVETPPADLPRGSDIPGLDALRGREPSFDPDKFVAGAQIAYETVVKAFAEGRRDELARLVGPEVMPSFEHAIAAREAEGRTERVEFQHTPRVDIQGIELEGDSVRIRTRFLAEFRSRTTGPEGEAVDDRRTADLWTFEREVGARDPNWTLVRVDAAEA